LYATFEKYKFNRQSQPLYVILDSKENILVEPFGYTARNVHFFLEKLNQGLK
jgi:hypothetical protein